MKAILFTLVAILGTACATHGKFKKGMNSWNGQPVKQLTSQWGEPKEVKQGPYGTSLLYVKDEGCIVEFLSDGVSVTGWKSNDKCSAERGEMKAMSAPKWNTRETELKEQQSKGPGVGALIVTGLAAAAAASSNNSKDAQLDRIERQNESNGQKLQQIDNQTNSGRARINMPGN